MVVERDPAQQASVDVIAVGTGLGGLDLPPAAPPPTTGTLNCPQRGPGANTAKPGKLGTASLAAAAAAAAAAALLLAASTASTTAPIASPTAVCR